MARRRSIIDFLLAQAGTVDVIMLQEVAQAEFVFFNEALRQNFEGSYVNHAPTYWSSWITPVPAWEPNGNAIFVRRARFNDVARIHEHNTAGNFTRKRHFMGDDNHRHTLFGQFAHGTQHLAGQFRIKR